MNIKSYEMLIKIENAIREFIFDFASKTNIFFASNAVHEDVHEDFGNAPLVAATVIVSK